MTRPAYVAVDLGAESGRVALGTLAGDRVELHEVHRFRNRPLRLPDGIRWNVTGILAELLQGLGLAASDAPIRGIGVDAWGVDYGLLDSRGRLLGAPFHHRDPRTAGMVELAHGEVSREELYATTGIQTMPINTVFQLVAEREAGTLDAADRLLMIPDLLGLWLTGEGVNEVTAASTTGLLDAREGDWARALIGRLGLPARVFGELVEPGTEVGPLLDGHVEDAGLPASVPVVAVAAHDTASAFVAVPAADEGAAVLSSGTWSLLGIELDGPLLDARAMAHNLTNERGVDGSTRLLRNVMGLWLVQECQRAWAADGGPSGYAELERLAADAPADAPLFDPDAPDLLAPGDMPARISRACARLGQAPPATRAEITRSVLTSLACKYRFVLEGIERASGRQTRTVHVVGGGARSELLCRLTADLLGLPVLAGPAEATALGNVLVQARTQREIGSLAEARAVASASVRPRAYEPALERDRPERLYARFLELTGLREPVPA